MSGRLIILGKKGYCPWNSKNLSRIRKDEKEHRDAQGREQEKHAQKASMLRLAALKKTGVGKDRHQQRFSLFEYEEKASFNRSNELQGSKSKVFERKIDIRNEGKTSKNKKIRDESPSRYNRFGGHFFSKQDKANDFYTRVCPIKEPLGKKELQLHREMDPMREFHEAQEVIQGVSNQKLVQNIMPSTGDVKISQREKRKGSFRQGDAYTEGKKDKQRKMRHRKESRSDKHRKSTNSKRGKSNRSSCKSTDSIEELRRKRAEREQQERHRQDAVLTTAKKL